jgi:hypothetical protein
MLTQSALLQLPDLSSNERRARPDDGARSDPHAVGRFAGGLSLPLRACSEPVREVDLATVGWVRGPDRKTTRATGLVPPRRSPSNLRPARHKAARRAVSQNGNEVVSAASARIKAAQPQPARIAAIRSAISRRCSEMDVAMRSPARALRERTRLEAGDARAEAAPASRTPVTAHFVEHTGMQWPSGVSATRRTTGRQSMRLHSVGSARFARARPKRLKHIR